MGKINKSKRYFDVDNKDELNIKDIKNKKVIKKEVVDETVIGQSEDIISNIEVNNGDVKDESKKDRISIKDTKNKKAFKNKIDPYNISHVYKATKFSKTFKPRKKGKYPGPAPIDEQLVQKHSRGAGLSGKGIVTQIFRDKLKKKDSQFEFANNQAARTEILLHENEGFIVPDEDEKTYQYTQDDIVKNVDITAATKKFDLKLDFGPYALRYTKNGRHLLLGGKKGHAAAFDWVTKRLHCEFNVMEEIVDVSWLHIETMFALAQKNWVHFYDNKGTELHCVKKFYRINCLEYLPYHFLLAAGNDVGFLSWLDVSIGELVADYNTNLGRISMMKQNPTNGVMCIGGAKGVVTMWSPMVKRPLATIFCHKTPLSALAVDPTGMYLATSGLDYNVKIWDIRELGKPLTTIRGISATDIDFSQKSVLALAHGNTCDVYKNPVQTPSNSLYLRQKCDSAIKQIKFCPYEDVLGISTFKGFTSILVPGSGEPNFDSTEDNPYRTKTQRREYEVRMLLEKIQPEFIALNPSKIIEVDVPTLKDKIEAKKHLLHVKQPKINYEPRNKAKKRGGTANNVRNKQRLQEESNKKFNKEISAIKAKVCEENTQDWIPLETKEVNVKVLDRFKTKKRK